MFAFNWYTLMHTNIHLHGLQLKIKQAGMYLHFLDNLHSKLLFVFNLNVFIIDRDKSWSFLFEAVFRGYLFICVLVCQVNKSHGIASKEYFTMASVSYLILQVAHLPK